MGNYDGRVRCWKPLVWHAGGLKSAKIHKVIKEQIGLVVGCVVLCYHKSEADARVGLQVSVGFEVGVEVLNRVEVLEFEVKLLDIVFCLPFENLGEVVHGGILDVVGWADDADNR